MSWSPRAPRAPGFGWPGGQRRGGGGLFTDYRERKAANTRRRQDAGLALFALCERSPAPRGRNPGAPTGAALASDPAAWAGVSWGLGAAFVRWALGQGYATGTVNGILSTLRTYAGLAAQAGALDPGELVLLRAVRGYTRTEGERVDEAGPWPGWAPRKQST